LQVLSSQNLSQQQFFDLLGTHICMPLLYYHCNVGLELRPICDVRLEPSPTFFSDLIIPHITLTPLSLSPSCRQPVLLQGGQGCIHHRGWR
jgi:hypothetical protein